MSWRAGMHIFLEVLPIIDKYETDTEFRDDFKADLLRLFLDCDLDPCGLEDDPTTGPIYAHMESQKNMRDDSAESADAI